MEEVMEKNSQYRPEASERSLFEKIPLRMKVGYGIGDFACNIVFQTITLYLVYFFTDVFMIGATMAGSIFFIAKIWNAVCDPTMGFITDRTSSRWGKNRPFLLFGAVPLGLAFFLIFLSPQIPVFWRSIYALVTFLLFSACYSVVNIPYGSLTASMTMDGNERSSLTGIRMACAILGTLATAGATKPVIAMFLSEVTGFRLIGAVFGGICVLVLLTTFTSVKECVAPPSEEKKSFKEDLKMVSQNSPFILLTVSTILQMVGLNLVAIMINYFFKYNLGRESDIPIAFMCMFVIAFVSMPFWVFMTKKLAKKTVLAAGTGLLALVTLALFFLENPDRGLIFGLFVVAGIGLSTLYLCPWAMIPDTVEYSQWKTGLRREGILYGFFNFAFKFSSAFAGFAVGLGLDLFKYVPNIKQQAITLFGIKLLMSVIPCIFIAAGIIIILFYPIDEAMHKRMVKDIQVGGQCGG
jgi:GPH family glycoside/pentoside/hexuronide:cation symporter